MEERLYIKGHDTRYKGVISLLETLGATNKYGLTGENGVNNKLFYKSLKHIQNKLLNFFSSYF